MRPLLQPLLAILALSLISPARIPINLTHPSSCEHGPEGLAELSVDASDVS